MKRRRNLLVALLLVCAMGIGVGYAALSGNLTINNTVEITAQEFAVVFTKYEVTRTNPAVGNQTDNTIEVEVVEATDKTADGGNLNNSTVTLDVTGMRDKGEIVVVTFTIKNKNDATMNLSAPVVDGETLDGMGTVECSNPVKTQLAFNEETTVNVTITLNKALTNAETKTVNNIKITIPAAPVTP